MPRLRAASNVRSSSAEPTPLLCQAGLDAERRLGLPRERPSKRPQFGRAAQHPVVEEAMHHRAQAERGPDVVADELVGNAATEPAMPAVLVEAQQMVAVARGFADPQFADHAVVGERFLHSKGS